MKICALIEFNICHDELFPSIVQELNKQGFFVHIFTKKQNIKKNSLIFSTNLKYKFFKTKYWNIFKVFGFYEKIIFNSFEDYRNPKKSFILKDIASIKSKNRARVLIHNSNHLLENLDQVLSIGFVPVFIAKYITKSANKKVNSEIIMPYYYGEFPKKDFKEEKIIFSVQGNFSNYRRNYKSLLNAVIKISDILEFKNRFVIKFVGRNSTEDAEGFKKSIQEHQLHDYFIFCENVENYKDFFLEVNDSDFIMPLIDSSSEELKRYFSSVSSSSINIAIAMAKPLIINSNFADNYPEFKDDMIIYENDYLIDGMIKAISLRKEKYYELSKNIEKKKYLEIGKNSLFKG